MKHNKLISSILISSLTIITCLRMLSCNNNSDKNKILENLKNTSGNSLKFHENPNNNQVFISGNLSKRNSSDSNEALKFIDEIKPVLSMKDVYKNLAVKSINRDDIGYTNIVFNQVSNNIPVESASISVHFNSSNVITNITSNINYDVLNSNQTLKRNIPKEKADTIIKKEFADNNPQIKFLSETVIVKKSHVYYCYKYNVYYAINNLGSYDVYVDMKSGKIIEKKSRVILNTMGS